MDTNGNIIQGQKTGRKSLIRTLLRGSARVVFALILLIVAVIIALYNPAIQDGLRSRLVAKLNADPDTEFRLDRFRLTFPLNIKLDSLLLVQRGDTMIKAGSFDGNVRLLPLFAGRVDVERAMLSDARYRVGSVDSASMVVLDARRIDLGKTTVRLVPMKIHVTKADLTDGSVFLYTNPVDTFPTPPNSEPTDLTIQADSLLFTNMAFRMVMLPTIDTLSAVVGRGYVADTRINMKEQTVDVGTFAGTRLDARYIMPDAETVAQYPTSEADDSASSSAPWTVRIGRIDLTNSHALYTTAGLRPQPGLDFAYIEASDLDLRVDSFYNRASVVHLPLDLTATERCGLTLDARGTLDIDSLGLTFRDFNVRTPQGTSLAFGGYMGTGGDLTVNPDVPLQLNADGDLAVADIPVMFPFLSPYLKGVKASEVDLDLALSGTSGHLDVNRLDINVARHISLTARGVLDHPFAVAGPAGKVDLHGTVTDVSNWTDALLAGTGVRIPTLTVDGSASINGNSYTADLTMHTSGGSLALTGNLGGTGPDYDIDLDADALPVSAFLPDAGVGNVTGHIIASGHGLDLFSTATHANIDAHIASVTYNHVTYRDIKLNGSVADGHADIDLDSRSAGLDATVKAQGNLTGSRYIWHADVDSRDLNLSNLGLVATDNTNLAATLSLDADISANMRDIDAILNVSSLRYTSPDDDINLVGNLNATLIASDSVTNISLSNRDLTAYYSSPMGIDSIMGRVTALSRVIDRQMAEHHISVDEVQHTLMPFRLDVDGGNANLVADYLSASDITFSHFSVSASNDSIILAHADLDNLRSGNVRLDSVNINIRQHGDRLDYLATVNNRPGTFDEWAHVDLDGWFDTDRLGVNLHQRNIAGKTGFDLGATITLGSDSTAVLHFEPYTPTINYRDWTVNTDNFIKYDFRHRHLDADLRMRSDGSSLALYTEHARDSIAGAHGADEDLLLQLFDIRIQDWIALNPFATPMTGSLSAGLRINWEDNHLAGSGTINLDDFTYGKERVGDLRAELNAMTTPAGLIRAGVDLWVNDQKAMTLSGALNDSTRTSPFDLDFRMIHFPLATANAFLPGVAKLGGSLNGSLEITGDKDNPHFNGYLDFDEATINVIMLGSTLTLAHDSIPVKDNLVTFDNFSAYAYGDNPLRVNGTVDISSLSSPDIKLDLNADNMQIVKSTRPPKGADVFGNAYVSLDAKARGNLDFLMVDATVDLMPGTNVTYVMATTASELQDRSNSDLVKFVNFADTAAVAAADSLIVKGTILDLDATVNIRTGSTINVELGNARDRVTIQGSGTLNYTSSVVGDGRLDGRFTFSSGNVRYSPPLVSNLNFDITEGSYVAWNGAMLNPRLNLSAVEHMRANVSQAGANSRLIYFDVIINVTGTLENMNVSFDLATDDDATVANELASMSPTQRASEAMNLLLYNTYTGGSTKATSNLNGNPLFSFLTGQLNSWAANNIRGVDLSFGIDQYDRTVNGSTSTTTSYSYRVSKSLFDDRFRIIVGGNYTNDANADENVAENLINDISFEYFLNDARTMYLRLFRHTGYESILEGEITQTGVGFVYKRKIRRLIDMFRPEHRRRKNKSQDKPATSTVQQNDTTQTH